MKNLLIISIIIYAIKDSLNKDTSTSTAIITPTTDTTTNNSTTLTNDTSTNSTDHSDTSGEENLPAKVDVANGGFTNVTFPDNFTCEQTILPTISDNCTTLNVSNFSCCYVTTKISGSPISNYCVAMNKTNLPAINFIVKVKESESFYDCKSLYLYSLTALYFLILIIY